MTRPVFLGEITISDDTLLKSFARYAGYCPPELEETLLSQLHHIFSLPRAFTPEMHEEDDLRVDLALADFKPGMLSSAEPFAIPLIWQPEIVLTAVLYTAGNHSMLRRFRVVGRTTWRELAKAAFSWRGMFSTGAFGPEELKILLNRAALRLLRELVDYVNGLPSR